MSNASLNYIEDFADLKRFAESDDCDVPSWVSSEILSALDVIKELRGKILAAGIADNSEEPSSISPPVDC